MSLAAGTMLGPYRVTGPLGAGGMGEVYRAEDTRLKRIVAIKVSQSRFSERFEREARAISSLSHPNLCTLFDVGSQDGVHYLVMEHLKGQPLQGPLPFDKLLKQATEICFALDAAHRKGIVHRDLKPSNVMVTPDGVKLLDFGLAKTAAEEAKPGPDDATATQRLTTEGTLLGTIPYMAPEQLEGKEADARSDIWALGAVLYEMATGKQAFQGATRASLIANIMTADPAPVASLQPATPPGLDRVIRGALAKDPDERWQSARDVALALRQCSGQSAEIPAAPAAKGTRWKIACGALAAALAVVAAVHLREPAPVQPSPVRFRIAPPEGTRLNTGNLWGRVSPDGTKIAFRTVSAAGTGLWIRSLDATESQRIQGGENGSAPFWSPDSSSIGFFADGKLKTVPVTGGPARIVCDAAGATLGTWLGNGVIVFDAESGPLLRVAAAGGTAAEATKLDSGRGETRHLGPFAAGGGRFLFRVLSIRPENSGVFSGSLDGAPHRTSLFQTRIFGAYGFHQRERAILAQRVDPDTLRTIGDPFPLASDSVGPSLSQNGVLAYQTGTSAGTTVELVLSDRQGNKLATFRHPQGGELGHPELSPDGRRVLADRVDPKTRQIDAWSVDLARGVLTRLTFGPRSNAVPVWSGDGATFYFSAPEMFRAPANGTGSPEQILAAPSHHKHVSADGKVLVFEGGGGPSGPGGTALSTLALDGSAKPQPLFHGSNPQFSPDARWIAYNSSESGAGQSDVFVQSYPPGKGKWQVSQGGGYCPRWRGDGREIYFMSAAGVMAVPVTPGTGGLEFGVPKLLFQPDRFSSNPAARFAVSADGQRFVHGAPVGEVTAGQIEVVVHWRPPAR